MNTNTHTSGNLQLVNMSDSHKVNKTCVRVYPLRTLLDVII